MAKQGVFQRLLIYLFGESYKTTVWGGIQQLAMAIFIAPMIIDFIPDELTKRYVQGIAGLISVVAGVKNSTITKATNVTGAGKDAEVINK